MLVSGRRRGNEEAAGASIETEGSAVAFVINSLAELAFRPANSCVFNKDGKHGAGGGSRTPTGVTTRQILSLVRLPIPPLRLKK